MTDKDKILELEQKIADRENDIKIIAISLLNGLSVVGIDVTKTNSKKDVIKSASKAVPKIMNDLMFNPSAIENKFAFISELGPLIDKYKFLFQTENNTISNE